MNDPTSDNRSPVARKNLAIILVVFAVLLLLAANSAFWFNRRVFDAENFTATVTQAVTDPSSVNALAENISGPLLQNRPLLSRVLSEPINKMIAGILDSSLAKNALDAAVARLHTAITSPNPQPIAIDLTGFKETLAGILNLAGNLPAVQNQAGGQPAVSVNDIPDQIVLLETSRLPNIYALGSTLLWVGPLALILAVVLLAIPLWQNRRSRKNLQKILLGEGIAVVAASLLGFMIGPIFKPAILANVSDPNVRIVADNIYSAFVQTYNNQTWWLFGIGCGFLIFSGVLYYQNRATFKG